MVVQLVAAVGGGFAGWAATGLLGMLLLLGGMGALLPGVHGCSGPAPASDPRGAGVVAVEPPTC